MKNGGVLNMVDFGWVVIPGPCLLGGVVGGPVSKGLREDELVVGADFFESFAPKCPSC